MVSTLAYCYCIYGVCAHRDCSLFIDYVSEPIESREPILLQCLALSQDPSLRTWQAKEHPRASDIFEIECVKTLEDAKEAVSFWRAYFRSLGETIIDAAHVCDKCC